MYQWQANEGRCPVGTNPPLTADACDTSMSCDNSPHKTDVLTGKTVPPAGVASGGAPQAKRISDRQWPAGCYRNFNDGSIYFNAPPAGSFTAILHQSYILHPTSYSRHMVAAQSLPNGSVMTP